MIFSRLAFSMLGLDYLDLKFLECLVVVLFQVIWFWLVVILVLARVHCCYSFLDKKEGRYNPKMSLVLPRSKWRKESQWISLVRSHAEVVLDDEVIFPVFKKFCKRRPPIDASKGVQNIEVEAKAKKMEEMYRLQKSLEERNGQLQASASTAGKSNGGCLGSYRSSYR